MFVILCFPSSVPPHLILTFPLFVGLVSFSVLPYLSHRLAALKIRESQTREYRNKKILKHVDISTYFPYTLNNPILTIFLMFSLSFFLSLLFWFFFFCYFPSFKCEHFWLIGEWCVRACRFVVVFLWLSKEEKKTIFFSMLKIILK